MFITEYLVIAQIVLNLCTDVNKMTSRLSFVSIQVAACSIVVGAFLPLLNDT